MTRQKKPGLYGEKRGAGTNRVTYLPQRPGGARGPREGTGEGGEAHGGDGAEGIRREAGIVLGFGPRSSPAIAWESDEPTARRMGGGMVVAAEAEADAAPAWFRSRLTNTFKGSPPI